MNELLWLCAGGFMGLGLAGLSVFVAVCWACRPPHCDRPHRLATPKLWKPVSFSAFDEKAEVQDFVPRYWRGGHIQLSTSVSGKYALVSTVDSMGDDFPAHCVILFETEKAAILYAVERIVECDSSTRYIKGEEVWTMGGDHWEEPRDFLEAWKDQLGPTEYFHIKPVVSAKPKAEHN